MVINEPIEFEKELPVVEVQDFMKFTNHSKIIYGIYLKLIKVIRKMLTCNRLDLETLKSGLDMLNILPRECSQQDGKNNLFFEMPKVGVLRRPSFLSEGLKWPKVLDLQRTPLTKNVAMLTVMSFFHPCLKSSVTKMLPIV
jgi:hypothetical protein